MRDIGDCVVWNSLAISCALSLWIVVDGPLARDIGCRSEGNPSMRTTELIAAPVATGVEMNDMLKALVALRRNAR